METEKTQKEQSKLERVESEVENTSSIITSIFQKVSNIEEKLGEEDSECSKETQKEEATSRFDRIGDKIQGNTTDLNQISDRLQSILNLL